MEREPTYRPGDVIETRDGRQLLVVQVREGSYVLRRLDVTTHDAEPRESAWEIAGCEDKTWLIQEHE